MLQKHFEAVPEKRVRGKIKYNLHETIVLVISAVLAGCEGWNQIEDFCKARKKWFKEKLKLGLKNGIPTHDTFANIFAMIDPKIFEKCFFEWTKAVFDRTEGEIIAIDGKTVRASRNGEINPIHMVSAWASESQLVLGQVKTDEKSNEITAIPELLEFLDIKGCIITSDAMGCQRKIVAQIAEKGGDYCISLKGNQGDLREDVELYFEDFKADKSHIVRDFGHGRIEKREYFLETEIGWLEKRGNWANLKGIGMVKNTVIEGKNTSCERRYFITSLADVQVFAKAVRAHWGIENGLHWCIDVGFNEDKSRIRKDNSGENFAVVRHIAMNLLKKDPAKMGIKSKRLKCGYDEKYLFRLIMSGF